MVLAGCREGGRVVPRLLVQLGSKLGPEILEGRRKVDSCISVVLIILLIIMLWIRTGIKEKKVN